MSSVTTTFGTPGERRHVQLSIPIGGITAAANGFDDRPSEKAAIHALISAYVNSRSLRLRHRGIDHDGEDLSDQTTEA